ATKSVKVNGLPSNVTANASSTGICLGTAVDLTCAHDAQATQSILVEAFNGASNAWTTTNTSTVGTPANAAWTLRADGYVYSGTTFNSNDNSQLYLTNSDAQGSGGITATTLESPAFSTIGMSSLAVDFYHYFRYVAGDSAIVEVYDGSVWTPATSYVATVGTSTAFVNANVDLSAYVGLPVVKVRFRYEATWGYYWAVDNVTISGASAMTYAWTSAPAGFTSTVQNPTAVIPTATTAYTVAVTNTYGCSSTASVNVNANTAPVVSLGNDTTICDDASITLNALNNGMSYLWNTTETTQLITVDSTGYGLGSFPFWVTVDNLGCQTTDTIHIIFAICGGIEENSANIAIYPNPTNGILYLSSGSFDDNMSVTITTVDGKLIMAEKVNTLNGTQQRKEIDLSKVPAGVYFVRMQGDNLDKISRIVKSY
ncbi:MAG: T9SS type A sorting domain-containing protein, partial [Bacteroidota bacterium]